MTLRPAIPLLALLALPLLGACRSTPPPPAFQPAAYASALARSAPAPETGLQEGSAAEAEAIARFVEFYRVYSYETVKAGVRDLYADDAFFADPFHMREGIDAIETYFLSAAEAVQTCTFDIEDIVGREGEYYFRWTMRLVTKRYPDDEILALGMSHVRFDEHGKVGFHQDYWDAGGAVYERIPVLRGLIRRVRARL